MRRLVLVAAAIVLANTVLAQEAELLGKAIQAYYDAKYDVADAYFSGIRAETLNSAEKVLFFKFLGATKLALQDPNGAEKAFMSLLQAAPDFQMTDKDFSPTVVSAFDRARVKMAQVWVDVGIKAYQKKHRLEAVDWLTLALKADPKNPTAKAFLPLAEALPPEVSSPAPAVAPTPTSAPATASALESIDADKCRCARSVLRIDGHPYIDSDARYTQIPPGFVGATALKTADGERGNLKYEMQLQLGRPVLVFVAHDRRIRDKPAWLLQSFSKEKGFLEVTESGGRAVRYDLYASPRPAGTTTLGPCIDERTTGRGFSMYLVFLAEKAPKPNAQ